MASISKFRVIGALFASSLAAPVVIGTLFAMGFGVSFGGLTFVVACLISIPVTLLFGFPFYWTLRRMGWLYLPPFVACGALLGAAVWVAVSRMDMLLDAMGMIGLLSFSSCGALSSLIFWLVTLPRRGAASEERRTGGLIATLAMAAIACGFVVVFRGGIELLRLSGMFPERSVSSEVSEVKLGPYKFGIPARYVAYPITERSSAEGVSIVALWPNFEGRTDANLKAFDVPGWGNRIRLALDDAALNTTVEFRFNVVMNDARPLSEEEVSFGLKKYSPGKPETGGRDAYAKGLGDKTMIISCNVEGAVPRPGCRHTFSDGGLLYEAIYSKELLPHWSDIQDGLIKLVNSFQAQP